VNNEDRVKQNKRLLKELREVSKDYDKARKQADRQLKRRFH